MMFGHRLLLSSATRFIVAKPSIRTVMLLKRKVKLPRQPSPINPLIVGPFLVEKPRYLPPRPQADFIYDEIEDTEDQPESTSKLRLILLETIDELGRPGDVVEVERDYGRFELLSSQRAVYASPYNLIKYKELIEAGGKDRRGPSSAFVMPTLKRLAKEVIIVVMNDQHEWTIQPHHIRIAFRTAGYMITDDKCIKLPDTPITGPDIENKQGKDFAVEITINDQEKVNVRCLLHHKSLPLRLNWNRKPRFILLKEQEELLEQMPVQDALEEDQYNVEHS